MVKYRDVLNEVQPHWAIAAAAVAALAAGASAYSGAQAQKKAKRNAANASQLAAQGSGAGEGMQATANRFAPSDDSRMGDVLKNVMPEAQQQTAPPAVPEATPSMTAPPIGGQSGMAPDETPLQRMQREEQERRARMGM